jgi:hypothetical protein
MGLAILEKPKTLKIDQRFIDGSVALYERMKADELLMAETKTIYVEAGPAEYIPTIGNTVRVIYPAPRIAILSKAEAAVVSKLLGKDKFEMLYEPRETWVPVKGCRDVAARILPGAKAKKIPTTDSPAQVRFG